MMVMAISSTNCTLSCIRVFAVVAEYEHRANDATAEKCTLLVMAISRISCVHYWSWQLCIDYTILVMAISCIGRVCAVITEYEHKANDATAEKLQRVAAIVY